MPPRKLVLFDIDGTILLTSGAGRRAIREALLAEVGTTGAFDRVTFDGKTDPQIVRELLSSADHPEYDREDLIQAICQRYVDLLEIELGGDLRVEVLDGVGAALDAVEAHVEAVLGLLTGNLRRGAELKLRAAGLRPERFVVGAFGSDAAHRPALPAFAVLRAKAFMPEAPSGEDVVIIGDTPADMTCGEAIGARAIGVATGRYEPEALRAAGAYAVFPDMTATDSLLDAIFG